MRLIERKKERDTIMEAFLFISQLENQNSAISITKPLIFLFMAALISVIFSQSYRKRKRELSQLPPGPTPWPVIGCLPAMWRNWPPHQWIHRVMKQLNTEIACIRLGNTHVIVVTSQELALECLKNHDSIFGTRPSTVTGNIMTDGYLTAAIPPSGDHWNKMRKVLVSHVLNSSTIRQMSRHRNTESDALVRHIFNLTTAKPGGTDQAVINVRSVTLHYCGHLIRRMLLSTKYYYDGREDGGPTFEEEQHIQALLTLLKYIHTFSISDFIPCLKWFDLDGHQKAVKQALKLIRRHDDPIINERLQQWKDDKNKKVNDILDVFITLRDDNGKPVLTIEEIKAQITELQMAAIDNPSFAVEWALLELMNEPKFLQKAIEELDKVVGKDRLVQESDIPQLKYLMAIIRECIRLHPFSPFNVFHASTSDAILAGYFIPKGSQILISRMDVGRNLRMWENPMQFNPDRHLDDDTIELGLQEPSQRFISFSRGRRGCIGVSLGTTVTMMLFARLLQGFSWSLLPGTTKVDFPNHADEVDLPNPLQLLAQPRLAHNLYPD